MNLIAFIPGHTETGERLTRAAEKALTGGMIDLSRNHEELLRQLCSPLDEQNLALLYAEGEPDLAFLIANGDWLRDFKIVLILPDRTEQTLSGGLRLRPRYIGYADSDFAEVTAVLKNMLVCGSGGKTYDRSLSSFQQQINSKEGAAHGKVSG